MAFNVVGFLIGRALAEREGVVDQASQNRVALMGGVVGPSATGLLVTSVLARREAESIPPILPIPPKLVRVPSVIGDLVEQAEKKIESSWVSDNPSVCEGWSRW